MWSFSNLARSHRNRSDSHIVPAKRSDALVNAGIFKGTAVAVAAVTGGISAYKGIPEIKGFAGFDVLGGLLLAGVEGWMLYSGRGGKATAAVGGASTGLLCHWAAVQGTIYGANKAKADAATKGFNYDARDVGAPVVSTAASSPRATTEFLG